MVMKMDEIDTAQQMEIERLKIIDKGHEREMMFLRMLMFAVFMIGILMVGLSFMALDTIRQIKNMPPMQDAK